MNTEIVPQSSDTSKKGTVLVSLEKLKDGILGMVPGGTVETRTFYLFWPTLWISEELAPLQLADKDHSHQFRYKIIQKQFFSKQHFCSLLMMMMMILAVLPTWHLLLNAKSINHLSRRIPCSTLKMRFLSLTFTEPELPNSIDVILVMLHSIPSQFSLCTLWCYHV